MRLDTSQHMRLEQRMKLAPRMIQSMEILQLPLMALQERIEQELISNPVLEMREQDPDAPPPDAAEADDEEDPKALPPAEKTLVVRNDQERPDDFQRLAEIADEEFDDYYSQGRGPSFRRVNAGERDHKLEAMSNTAARDVSLHEYLTFQWALIEGSDEVRHAGQLIVNHLEDDGYLRLDLAELAKTSRTPLSIEQMERALILVQTLDPPGVGARDLQECLLLQLDAVQSPPPIHALARTLAAEQLANIEANRLPAIARITGATQEKIQEAIKYLHRFDPKPGQRIGQDQVPYILPDVMVDYAHDGNGYEVRLASGSEPTLYINRMYRRMLRSDHLDGNTREFIKRNIQSARWLIESLEQRRSTLMRVAGAIVTAQRDFLDNGPKFLKPLPMSQIADQLGIHVATVSRAVSDKYIQTPRGIYPLRQFFSTGTAVEGGESLSWDAVRAKIEEIIEHEDRANPLSDDQIVDMLLAVGIVVARRTVAKYRKVLNISPARQRKSF